MNNSDQLNNSTPKSSLLNKLKFSYLSNKNKYVSMMSVLIAVIMTGSVFYIGYKTYSSRTSPTNTGAANPSCYIELALATPTATIVPTPTPTPIACTAKLDIMLVIDRSSTMTDVESDGRIKLEWAKDAARDLVNAVINSGSKTVRVGVTTFGAQGNDGTGTLDASYNTTLDVPLTMDLNSVISAINNISYKKNGTCIECGLRIGNSQLASSTNKRVEILLSDGIANHTWNGVRTTAATAAAINAANAGRSAGIDYRVLGYGQGTNINETTLVAIAGSTANYKYKPNASDWSAAFLEILNDICKTPTPSPVPSPKPTTISVSADSYVVAGTSTNRVNYGKQPKLISWGSPVTISYLKFDLTSLVNRSVSKAVLRLTVNDASAGVQNLYTTGSSWLETAINYSNRPTINTALITTFTSPTIVTKDIDITAFVKNNVGKVVTFMINSSNSDSFGFNSKESTSGKPLLYVE